MRLHRGREDKQSGKANKGLIVTLALGATVIGMAIFGRCYEPHIDRIESRCSDVCGNKHCDVETERFPILFDEKRMAKTNNGKDISNPCHCPQDCTIGNGQCDDGESAEIIDSEIAVLNAGEFTIGRGADNFDQACLESVGPEEEMVDRIRLRISFSVPRTEDEMQEIHGRTGIPQGHFAVKLVVREERCESADGSGVAYQQCGPQTYGVCYFPNHFDCNQGLPSSQPPPEPPPRRVETKTIPLPPEPPQRTPTCDEANVRLAQSALGGMSTDLKRGIVELRRQGGCERGENATLFVTLRIEAGTGNATLAGAGMRCNKSGESARNAGISAEQIYDATGITQGAIANPVGITPAVTCIKTVSYSDGGSREQ